MFTESAVQQDSASKLDHVSPQNTPRAAVWIDSVEHFLDRYRRPLFAIIVLLYVLGYNQAWRIQTDSAMYLEVGRNIAQGNGFTLEGQPNRLGYPGLPYLLSTLYHWAPNHTIPVANAVILAISLASLAATYRLLRRVAGRSRAVTITLLFANTVVFMKASFLIMTDMPFFLGVQAMLLGCECTGWLAAKPITEQTVPRTPADRWAGWLLLIPGLILAGLMRPMVLPFVGAMVVAAGISAWQTRRWRAAGLGMLVLVAAAVAVYMLDPRRVGGRLDMYEQQVFHQLANLPQWWRILLANLAEFCHDTVPSIFFGYSFTWPGDVMATLVLVCLCGWLFRVRPVWALWTLAVMLTMLAVVVSGRYLLPVMPLLLLAWWHLARWIGVRLGGLKGNIAAMTLIVLLVPGLVRSWGSVWWPEQMTPCGQFNAHYRHGAFQSTVDMAELVRENTPANALIVHIDANAGIVRYLSGREVIQTWRGVTRQLAPRPVFVVLDQGKALTLPVPLRRWLTAGEEWFTPDRGLKHDSPKRLCSMQWRTTAPGRPSSTSRPATSPTRQR